MKIKKNCILTAGTILAVVAAHSSFYLLRLGNAGPLGGAIRGFIGCAYPLAAFGVDLFFVLSGFLIGNILIRIFINNDTFSFRDVRSFWIRRWFRTLPLYWLILTTDIVLYHFLDLRSHEMNKAFDYLFIQNLWYPHPVYFFGEAWSLSVEEWFYLTLPITMYLSAIVFKPENKKKFLLRVFAGYLAVFVLLRFLNAFHPINGPDQEAGIRKVVAFRLDAVMYGVLIAYFNNYHSAALKKLKNILLATGIAGIIFIAWLMIDSRINITDSQNHAVRFASDAFLYLLTPLFCSLCLPFAYNILFISNRYVCGFFTHISKISYSMYLVHYSLVFIPFFNNMKPVSMPTAALYYLLYWAIVIGFSSFLYKYYEYPVTRLRDRFSEQKQ